VRWFTSNALRIRGVPISDAGAVTRYATVAVSSAEIKALNGAPKTLIAAQGANTFIEVLASIFKYNYGTATYVNGAGGAPTYTIDFESAGVDLTVTGGALLAAVLKGTASGIGIFPNSASMVQASGTSNFINKAIQWRQTAAANRDLATGDGTCDVRMIYRVHIL
jgi:hypothetical protein